MVKAGLKTNYYFLRPVLYSIIEIKCPIGFAEVVYKVQAFSIK